MHLGQAWKIELSYRNVFTYHYLLGALLGRAWQPWVSPDFPMLLREQGAYPKMAVPAPGTRAGHALLAAAGVRPRR
jgi:hypothetical protein